MVKDKLLTAVTVVLFATGLLCIGYVAFNSLFLRNEIAEMGETSCVRESTTLTMQDEHMAGLLDKGQTYKVLKNYYACNPVGRNQLVWFRISPPIDPVVRVVKGLPGDKFEVIEDKENQRWHLKVNDQFLMAGDEKYFIKSNTVPPLKTYEISRKGKLAKDEYIILSNRPPGLSDSSNLGLVKAKAFEGKVILAK